MPRLAPTSNVSTVKCLMIQCVYERIELPCTLCKSRGFPCGAADKIWGPQSNKQLALQPGQFVFAVESPQLPLTQIYHSARESDHEYIQFFLAKLRNIPLTSSEALKLGFWPSQVGPLIPAHRVISASEPLRLAVLSYASFYKAGSKLSIPALQYFGRCLLSIINATSVLRTVDLLYAVYTLIILAFENEEPINTVLIHLSRICRDFNSLAHPGNGLDIREYLWMERLWQNMFHRLYGYLLENRSLSAVAIYMESIYQILQNSEFLLEPDPRESIVFSEDKYDPAIQKVQTAAIYMQYYFCHYLLQINLAVNDRRIVTAPLTVKLSQVLHHIVTSISQVKHKKFLESFQTLSQFNFNDYIQSGGESHQLPTDVHGGLRYGFAFSLYFSAMLINSTLDAAPDPAAYYAAISLSKIIVLRPTRPTEYPFSYFFDVRNLFLAGLILTRSRYPAGNCF